MRDHQITVRLTDKEYEALAVDALISGLTVSDYTRKAIAGGDVRIVLSDGTADIIKELRKVGYKMDRILRDTDGRVLPDAALLKKILDDNRSVENRIARVYGSKWKQSAADHPEKER